MRVQCLGQCWYTAADTQMYLMAPLVLLPLAYSPAIGIPVPISVRIKYLSTYQSKTQVLQPCCLHITAYSNELRSVVNIFFLYNISIIKVLQLLLTFTFVVVQLK